MYCFCTAVQERQRYWFFVTAELRKINGKKIVAALSAPGFLIIVELACGLWRKLEQAQVRYPVLPGSFMRLGGTWLIRSPHPGRKAE
jgi:hypothetical protein